MSVKTGYMSGPTYYSDTMPKGEGDKIEFNPRLFDLADLIYHRTEEAEIDSVIAIQDELLKIGYLDVHNPESSDTHLGPMTRGAAWRYLQNYEREALMDNLSDNFWKLFGY